MGCNKMHCSKNCVSYRHLVFACGQSFVVLQRSRILSSNMLLNGEFRWSFAISSAKAFTWSKAGECKLFGWRFSGTSWQFSDTIFARAPRDWAACLPDCVPHCNIQIGRGDQTKQFSLKAANSGFEFQTKSSRQTIICAPRQDGKNYEDKDD